MTALTEKHLIILSDAGTDYRVRPNPDASPEDDAGLVLDWRNQGETEWNGYFFISPDAILPLIDALREMVEIDD